MIRILQLGKASIINDIGWFAEIPDDCAVKLGLENIESNLEKCISKMIDDEAGKKAMGENAAAYIKKEFAPEIIVEQIREFI
ncbi:MAG: hypothetical protein J6P37_05580 [Lachnospiraceae bacterium]|nr:hypothetical protein [Lachnospiraceae bacterium]